MKNQIFSIFLILFFLFIPVLIYSKPVLAVSSPFPTINLYRLTYGFQREDWPVIYKDTVYWLAEGIINGYNLKSQTYTSLFQGVQPLTNLYAPIGFDGRYLVYESYDNVSYNVRLYDLNNKKDIAVTNGPGSWGASDFDGNNITYTSDTGNLYIYNINKNQSTFITSGAYVPRISGNHVVWYTSGGIRVYDLTKNEYINIPNPENADLGSPDVYGNIVVYVSNKNNSYSVRQYDLD